MLRRSRRALLGTPPVRRPPSVCVVPVHAGADIRDLWRASAPITRPPAALSVCLRRRADRSPQDLLNHRAGPPAPPSSSTGTNSTSFSTPAEADVAMSRGLRRLGTSSRGMTRLTTAVGTSTALTWLEKPSCPGKSWAGGPGALPNPFRSRSHTRAVVRRRAQLSYPYAMHEPLTHAPIKRTIQPVIAPRTSSQGASPRR